MIIILIVNIMIHVLPSIPEQKQTRKRKIPQKSAEGGDVDGATKPKDLCITLLPPLTFQPPGRLRKDSSSRKQTHRDVLTRFCG